MKSYSTLSVPLSMALSTALLALAVTTSVHAAERTNDNNNSTSSALDERLIELVMQHDFSRTADEIEFLIERGANVNVVIHSDDKQSFTTPLHEAVMEYGAHRLVALLLKAGADTNLEISSAG